MENSSSTTIDDRLCTMKNKLDRQKEILDGIRKKALEAEDVAATSLKELQEQRETILASKRACEETNRVIDESDSILAKMASWWRLW